MASKFDKRAQEVFLQAYEECGTPAKIMKDLGFSTTVLRNARKKDPEFDERCNEAYSRFRDKLEKEALRRAVEGYEEQVFYQGTEMPDKRRVKSDRIFELVLKRHIPEYRDKLSADVTIGGGVLLIPNMPKSAEEWQKKYGDPGVGADD